VVCAQEEGSGGVVLEVENAGQRGHKMPDLSTEFDEMARE
jgi:hypothetical protein